MDRAEIYRRAAVLCQNAGRGDPANYSCTSIGKASNWFDGNIERYSDTFKPRLTSKGHMPWGNSWARNNAERKPIRVLALCFAAAMAETGDL
jgi:hypothetical protein